MGWRVYELWTEEWPSYKPHLKRFWQSILGKYEKPNDHDNDGYWVTLSHSYTNLGPEFFESFRSTLGHILMLIVVPWIIITSIF